MGRVAKTFSVLGFTAAAAAGAYGYIVASFPAPCSDAMGLGWDGAYLWCNEYDPDHVYRLDPRNGSVISSFRVGEYPPMYEPVGLTCAEGYVVSAHKMPNAFFVSTYRGARVRYIAPCDYGYALTWDGEYYWGMENYFFVAKYDRWLGEVVSSFPGAGIRSLGWDGEYLIAGTDSMLMKLTTTGSCVATMRSPWAFGCACGNGYIWVLEPTLDYIFKLRPSFKPTGLAPGSFGKVKALFR